MTNEELKKKIESIIRNAKRDFAYCVPEEWAVKVLADALIEAGLIFDKTTVILAERTNSKTLIHKAQYYDEMKHRAEVAERAVYNLAYGEWQREGARRAICEKYAPSTAQDYLDRAEKELAEEGKDENI